MKLSAPKKMTWWVAITLGVVGFLGSFMALGGLSFSVVARVCPSRRSHHGRRPVI